MSLQPIFLATFRGTFFHTPIILNNSISSFSGLCCQLLIQRFPVTCTALMALKVSLCVVGPNSKALRPRSRSCLDGPWRHASGNANNFNLRRSLSWLRFPLQSPFSFCFRRAPYQYLHDWRPELLLPMSPHSRCYLHLEASLRRLCLQLLLLSPPSAHPFSIFLDACVFRTRRHD